MKNRALTLVLALVLAVVGTSAVLAYTHGANARALAGMKAVSALVAAQQIPAGASAGTLVSQGLVHTEKLPASSVPANALPSIAPALGGLVTNEIIQPGQLLLRPMLATSAPVTGGLPIAPGMVAITVNFCEPEAVAGYIHPGSEVEIFDTVESGVASLTASANCSGTHQQQGDTAEVKTVPLLASVKVLAVGAAPAAASVGSTLGGSSSASANSLVTVALSPADAEKLIEATVAGLPYLALVTTSSAPGSGTS